MRSIAIRIDDVTPKTDWKKFSRLCEMLDRHGICPLIGVVPECRDPKLDAGADANPDFADEAAYIAWLKERRKKGWVIAMHGRYHLYTTKSGGLFPLNRFSEFAGLPYEEQLALIRGGVEVMKKLGAESDIFMAPGHSYDANTLRALKECGFRFVTDGYGSAPYQRAGLTFFPISFLRSRELKKKEGITTFVLHPAEMSDAEFDEYEKLFSENREQFVDYGEFFKRPVRRSGGGIPEYLMAAAKSAAGKIL